MGVALRHSGLRRVDLVSPYIDWKNEMLIAFLAAAGVSVAGCDSFRAQNPTELASITGEMVLQKCLDVARPDSEGLFIACVQLPTIDAIPVLAARLQRPVWSAVRAAALATLEALGLPAERLVPARATAERRDRVDQPVH
jgi:maleate isomerase